MKTEEYCESYCESDRPRRKVFCQKKKGHKGECRAVIFWKKEGEKRK